MTRKQYSAEERAEYRARKRADARDALETAARALLDSDGWRRWAETRATFHKYSANNCMLIALQRPEATEVAGFHKWRELGRQVRKGERGISIMAPMSVKERDAAGDETGEVRTFFRSVSVFDLAQTDGDPLPEVPREPITGDSHEGYLPKLTAYAQQLGLVVDYEALEHAGGYYSERERRIVISTSGGYCANRRVRTLVHELAHAHGVNYREYGRDDAEVLAETAAFIVCSSIGLDTSSESVPYVAGWGEDTKLDAVREYAGKVDELARTLEGALSA
jgi:antirestriction protein ArdC